MKKTKLRKSSKSPLAQIKKDIQALVREIAIKIYGTCVLSKYPETGACGYYTKSGNLVLQAEHLVSRERNFCFGDMRNIVLLCWRHHFKWKPKNSRRYWELIREIIGEKRWAWYLIADEDRKTHIMKLADWELV